MAIMDKNLVSAFIFPFFCVLFSLVLFCHGLNTISQGQSVEDGEKLISVDENFELGFFSPENSTLRYLGIRYHSIQDQAVIWVANRERPISDTSGVLMIGEDGNLVVKDGNGTLVWSSNVNSSIISNDTAAILETTGNFILSSSDSTLGDTSKAYWQSFNNPMDTYLPNMNVPASSAMGENHAFTSWKSASDPSPGNFTMGIDPRGAPQLVIWEQSRRRWRSGHWDAQIFIGLPQMTDLTNYQYGFKVTSEEDGNLYITYNPSNASDLLRFRLSWHGYGEQLKWNENQKKWDIMQREPANDCEHYNYCGDFGVCSVSNSPKCNCMQGFEPRHPDQWKEGNWSGGCVRRSPLQCQIIAGETDGGGGFTVLKNVKLPDFAHVEPKVSSETCKEMCLRNCSCNAYALTPGIGCMIWSMDLIDVQQFDQDGSSMYLRLADSELGGRGLSKFVIAIIAVAGVIFLVTSFWLLWKLNIKLRVLPVTTSMSCMRMTEIPRLGNMRESGEYSPDLSGPADLVIEGSQVNGPDLQLFNFNCVAAATDNFSTENKLGQGGFGPVYKGKLPGGEEIAVKRLSKISGQGLEEFKNEIILIAKLQHINLVRLLGCCIQGEEKMLLYEYLPNKSLDCFIFDPAKQAQLDWRKRFTIIEGIARGLIYLHRDSRLRIIHRDLKASNILLDEDMNPKISDFGLARIFGGNQNEANTSRVVGTYGYMAPEYAMEGLFSVKSDVYSFGILLLEIVSGRRNTSFRSTDHMSLIAYAWELWSEGNAMELVDPSIRDSCCENEVLRSIQVGMMCVQDSPVHRPPMHSVVRMLESDTTTLPLPQQPTFTSMRTSIDTEFYYMDGQEIASSNDVTVTMVVGR